MSSTPFFKISIFAFIIAIFYSCTVEQKFASSFVSKKNKGAVLVITPDLIYKTNLKKNSIIQNDSLSQFQKDSLLQLSDLFLQYIDEKNFVDISLDYMKDELIGMGFQVYDENSIDQFMQTKDSSYVLRMSQVEIEEGYGSRNQIDYFYDQAFDVKVDVNFVNFNFWFELERKNITDEKFPLLYTTYSLMDGLDGEFEIDENEKMRYNYNLDTLSLKDFSKVPELLGKKYASYFCDYVLNISILESLPADKLPTYYFHFDPNSKKVYPIIDEYDHFIEIAE